MREGMRKTMFGYKIKAMRKGMCKMILGIKSMLCIRDALAMRKGMCKMMFGYKTHIK